MGYFELLEELKEINENINKNKSELSKENITPRKKKKEQADLEENKKKHRELVDKINEYHKNKSK